VTTWCPDGHHGAEADQKTPVDTAQLAIADDVICTYRMVLEQGVKVQKQWSLPGEMVTNGQKWNLAGEIVCKCVTVWQCMTVSYGMMRPVHSTCVLSGYSSATKLIVIHNDSTYELWCVPNSTKPITCVSNIWFRSFGCDTMALCPLRSCLTRPSAC